MSAPRYPLAAVLALRAREEAVARGDLARAFAAEAAAERARLGPASRAAAGAASLAGAEAALAAGSGDAGALRARARFAGRLREEAGALAAEVARAEVALAAARGEVEARRAALAVARGALRALERHRDAWRLERSRRRERAEEAAVEDAVSGRRAAR